MKTGYPKLGRAAAAEFVVADDHPTVRLAVAQILGDALGVDPATFTMVGDTEALLQACRAPAPSEGRILVLDLVMPGVLKRAMLVRRIRSITKMAGIVVYTADDSPFLAEAVLEVGADAYVAKTSPADVLIQAVRQLEAGKPYIDPNINMARLKAHAWPTLTESERDVFIALCRGGKPKGIMTETRRCYSTVMTHKDNALRKLGLRAGDPLLPYVYENGLVHVLDEDHS